jgi:hypothetical protein
MPYCQPSPAQGVRLPNGSVIYSIASLQVTLNVIGPTVTAYIFSDIDLVKSLLGLSPLLQHPTDCVTFTATEITATHQHAQYLHGTKRPNDTLWHATVRFTPVCFLTAQSHLVPDVSPATSDSYVDTANLAIRSENQAEFVNFVHQCFGNPTASTFLKACKAGWLRMFPLLTPTMIQRNMPNSLATEKGHLDLQRQGVSSSKTLQLLPLPTDDTDDDDTASLDGIIWTRLFSPDSIEFTDTTGPSPQISQKGNRYVLVAMLNGYIHFELLKSRSGPALVAAHAAAIAFFRERTTHIRLAVLDNEVSADLRLAFNRNNLEYHQATIGLTWPSVAFVHLKITLSPC